MDRVGFYVLFTHPKKDIDGPFFFSKIKDAKDFFCEYIMDLYKEELTLYHDDSWLSSIEELIDDDYNILPRYAYDFDVMNIVLNLINREYLRYSYDINDINIDAVKTKKHKNTLIFKKAKMIK